MNSDDIITLIFELEFFLVFDVMETTFIGFAIRNKPRDSTDRFEILHFNLFRFANLKKYDYY